MRHLRRVAVLTALWLLAWGEISLVNVASGAVVAATLLAVSTPASPPPGVRLNPLGALRLVGYVVVQLVSSNVMMIGEVLRRRPTTQPGVIVHRLSKPSAHVVTVMSSVIALSPGTMTVDVDPTSSAISVHFLFLRDVAAAHASIAQLERIVLRAITDTADNEPVGAP